MKPAGRRFMRATYPDRLSKAPQDQSKPQPPLELPLPPDASLIHLPSPETLHIPEINLRSAIEHRRTRRKYSEEPLTQAELSYLLWLTQGVKSITSRPATQRTVPSAGARHAFETYLLVNRVDDLPSGLYRFAASQHALVQIPTQADLRAAITHACWDKQQIYTSAVTFIWVAVMERMAWRYVERGYRYLFIDAGHICQNLYLAGEAINCGVCAIGGFDDALLNPALDLDGDQLFVVYLASVGKRPA